MSTQSYKTYGASFTLCAFNSLVNAAVGTAGTAYNNATNGFLFGDFELIVAAQAAARTTAAGPTFSAVLQVAPDGTNYSDLVYNVSAPLVVWQLDAVVTARRLFVAGVSLPQALFKGAAQNNSGQTTAAAANSIIVYPYNLLVV